MNNTSVEFDASEFDSIPDTVPASGPVDSELTTPKPAPQRTMPTLGNKPSNSGKSYATKEKKYFVVSTATIKLYDKPTVEPLEIDPNNYDTDYKVFTLCFPTASFKMNPEAEVKVVNILKMLKAKGYKVRFIVDQTASIYDTLLKIFGDDNMLHVIPWPTFTCSVPANTQVYIPTDVNIRAAAFYYPKRADGKGKSFAEMSTFGQIMTTCTIAALFGPKNITPSEYVILVDPWLGDGKEIDWDKSKYTGNMFLATKKLGFSVVNLAVPSEYKDLEELLI